MGNTCSELKAADSGYEANLVNGLNALGGVVLHQQSSVTNEASEDEILEDLIAVHEDGIRRLPASSELRASLARALPFLLLAVQEPPEPPAPRQRTKQLRLHVQPLP